MNKRITHFRLQVLFLFVAIVSFVTMISIVSAEAINATHAQGLVVYNEQNTATPRYRLWNETLNNFTAELTDTSDIGHDINWIVTKGSHERDEIITVIGDQGPDVHVEVWSANDEWTNATLVSDLYENANMRGFDVAYEEVSGDALIVYEQSSDVDRLVGLTIWNGSAFSAEINYSMPLDTGEVRWIKLIPQLGSDKIMVLIHNDINDLLAVEWDGSTFDATTEFNLSTATTTITEEDFAFAWEGSSTNHGAVIYGVGNTLTFRNYTGGGSWSGEETVLALGQELEAPRVCADPNSDYIGFIWQDGGNDVNVRMWNGTDILVSPPSQDATTEVNGANNMNVDCVWINGTNAIFGFIDNGGLGMDHFNFTKPNTWSTADLGTTETSINIATDDINGMRFVKHPTTEAFMVLGMDRLADTGTIYWDGSQFSAVGESPIGTNAEQSTAQQEGAMFDWYRYDPEPTVAGPLVNETAIDLSATINITTNVTDNIALDTVLINVTQPDGTIVQRTATNVGDEFNLTFGGSGETDQHGTYTIRVVANDTSRHWNINDTETITFTAGDVIAPSVVNVTGNATEIDLNGNINITVNVTETDARDVGVDTVLINITVPGVSGFDQYIMTNITGTVPGVFNLTFANTSTVGEYTARIIANDTQNNINDTETFTFFVGDAVNPNATQLSVNVSVIKVDENINFTVNVTDDKVLDTILANITIPGVSGFDQHILTNISGALPSIFNLTFANTSTQGTYQIRVIANDTGGNINDTETISFSVGDSEGPAMTLNGPIEFFNTSIENITFNFTAIDDGSATIDCDVTVDSSINVSNSSVDNNTITILNGIGFAEGSHLWNVTCSDANSNSNTSVTRNFTIDQSIPDFFSLTSIPSSADDVDPNVALAFYANVTDNVTAVDTVFLQHKNSTTADFANTTMAFNSSNNLYEASFTPTGEDTWNFRVFANDSANNRGQSTQVDITVENDETWTRSPVSVAVGTTPNQSISFANITINNTGDSSRDFSMIATWENTTFNTTFPLTLAAKEAGIVEVTITAPVSIGGNSFVFEINATGGDPASRNISATLAITEGQPFLAATFTSLPENITKSNSDTHTIEAQVENIGTGNASNGSIYFTIPSDWVITGGDLNTTWDELTIDDDPITGDITFQAPTNSSEGERTIKVNTTGVNGSGINLESLSSISGDESTINVNNETGTLGGTSAGGGGGGAGGGGGGAGGAGAPATYVGQTKLTKSFSSSDLRTDSSNIEIINTDETIYVVRGNKTEFWFGIKNIYNNSAMKNVYLEIEGYLAQYMTWTPEFLSNIATNNTGEFLIAIEAPSYKNREEHILNFTITSEIVAKYIDFIYNNQTGFNDTLVKQVNTKIVEHRAVKLIIIETTLSEAEDKVQFAYDVLALFKQYNFGTKRVEQYITKMEELYASEEYGDLDNAYQELKATTADATLAYNILTETQQKYNDAKAKGYDVEQLKVLMQLTEAAIAREDFASAALRAKEMQLYQIIVVEQQFNLKQFLLRYWFILLLSLILLLIGGFYAERKIFLATVDKKLNDIDKEEEELQRLKEEAQKLCFNEKKISPTTYHKRMYQYEDRINTLQKQRATLKRRKHLMPTKEEIIEYLQKDTQAMIGQLKQVQELYYNIQKLSKPEYKNKIAQFNKKIVENERDISLTQAILKKEAKIEAETKKHIKELDTKQIWIKLKKGKIGAAMEAAATIVMYCHFKAKGWIKTHVFHAEKYHRTKKRKMVAHLFMIVILVISLFTLSGVFVDEDNQVTGATTYGGGYIKHIEAPTIEQQEKDAAAYQTYLATKSENDGESKTIADIDILDEIAVREVTDAEVKAIIASAEADIIAMEAAGLQTTYVKDLLLEMVDEGTERTIDYEEIEENAAIIANIKQQSLYLIDTLALKEVEIVEFEDITGYDTRSVWELFETAHFELDQERYDNARIAIESITPGLNKIQIEQTRLTTLLDAQRNRAWQWIKANILQLILATMIVSVLGSMLYLKGRVLFIKRKIDNLQIELDILNHLIKKAQEEFYKEGKISKLMYDMKVTTYKERIEEIKSRIPVLRTNLKKIEEEERKSYKKRLRERWQKIKGKGENVVTKIKGIEGNQKEQLTQWIAKKSTVKMSATTVKSIQEKLKEAKVRASRHAKEKSKKVQAHVEKVHHKIKEIAKSTIKSAIKPTIKSTIKSAIRSTVKTTTKNIKENHRKLKKSRPLKHVRRMQGVINNQLIGDHYGWFHGIRKRLRRKGTAKASAVSHEMSTMRPVVSLFDNTWGEKGRQESVVDFIDDYAEDNTSTRKAKQGKESPEDFVQTLASAHLYQETEKDVQLNEEKEHFKTQMLVQQLAASEVLKEEIKRDTSVPELLQNFDRVWREK